MNAIQIRKKINIGTGLAGISSGEIRQDMLVNSGSVVYYLDLLKSFFTGNGWIKSQFKLKDENDNPLSNIVDLGSDYVGFGDRKIRRFDLDNKIIDLGSGVYSWPTGIVPQGLGSWSAWVGRRFPRWEIVGFFYCAGNQLSKMNTSGVIRSGYPVTLDESLGAISGKGVVQTNRELWIVGDFGIAVVKDTTSDQVTYERLTSPSGLTGIENIGDKFYVSDSAGIKELERSYSNDIKTWVANTMCVINEREEVAKGKHTEENPTATEWIGYNYKEYGTSFTLGSNTLTDESKDFTKLRPNIGTVTITIRVPTTGRVITQSESISGGSGGTITLTSNWNLPSFYVAVSYGIIGELNVGTYPTAASFDKCDIDGRNIRQIQFAIQDVVPAFDWRFKRLYQLAMGTTGTGPGKDTWRYVGTEVIVDSTLEEIFKLLDNLTVLEAKDLPLIVSDTTNFCMETEKNAVLATKAGTWTELQGSDWIWSVPYAGNQWRYRIATMIKTVTLPGDIKGIVLYWAVDDIGEWFINDVSMGSGGGITKVTETIFDGEFFPGENEFKFKGENVGRFNAGILYALHELVDKIPQPVFLYTPTPNSVQWNTLRSFSMPGIQGLTLTNKRDYKAIAANKVGYLQKEGTEYGTGIKEKDVLLQDPIIGTEANLYVGQNFTYNIYRSYVYFDTSEIDYVPESIYFWFTVLSDFSTQDFFLKAYLGDWGTDINPTDWDIGTILSGHKASCEGMSIGILIPLESVDLTKGIWLELRSDRDEDILKPITNEYQIIKDPELRVYQ